MTFAVVAAWTSSGTFEDVPDQVQPTASRQVDEILGAPGEYGVASQRESSLQESATEPRRTLPELFFPSPNPTTEGLPIFEPSNIPRAISPTVVSPGPAGSFELQCPALQVLPGSSPLVRWGQPAQFQCSIQSVNGFAGVVTPGCRIAAAGEELDCSFNRTEVRLTAGATVDILLTVTVTGPAQVGAPTPYPFTLTAIGIDRELVNDVTTGYVQLAPGAIFDIDCPESVSVSATGSTRLECTVGSADGFKGPLALSSTQDFEGSVALTPQNPTVDGGPVSITVEVGPVSSGAGTYQLELVGDAQGAGLQSGPAAIQVVVET